MTELEQYKAAVQYAIEQRNKAQNDLIDALVTAASEKARADALAAELAKLEAENAVDGTDF